MSLIITPDETDVYVLALNHSIAEFQLFSFDEEKNTSITFWLSFLLKVSTPLHSYCFFFSSDDAQIDYPMVSTFYDIRFVSSSTDLTFSLSHTHQTQNWQSNSLHLRACYWLVIATNYDFSRDTHKTPFMYLLVLPRYYVYFQIQKLLNLYSIFI